MKKIKTRFKLIFALCAVFISAVLCGIAALPDGQAKAATGGYNAARYPADTKVGYYAEYLGAAGRHIPEVKNEGIASEFPVYGEILYGAGENAAKKSDLLKENGRLLSAGLSGINGCTYDCMDADGNLYLGVEKLEGRTLYKHTAAKSMYYGDVPDGEEAVVKRISYKSRAFGNHLTGLYAPAGEVISVTMTKDDFEKCGGLKMFVGQVLSNDGERADIPNNIWTAREFNRMPFIVNAMSITADTATLKVDEAAGTVTGYFGSFFGGPIYLKPLNGGAEFAVTISGGVRYSHFILGYTTESEFAENAKSGAPFFDLEIWDGGVRHSGPRSRVSAYTYKQLYDAAVFWEKVASVSAQVPSNVNRGGIVDIIYDCFVGAGGASNSIVCKDGLFTSALDYNSISKDGCAENLTEYFRLFQTGWGLTGYGEGANGALTLLTHSLFTEASAARNFNEKDEGLDGLNKYLSASNSLNALKGDRENVLPVYAVILHSFGADAFLKAAGSRYGSGNDGWFRAVVDATKRDMTYYFTTLCGLKVSKQTLSWAASLGYPMFVPVSCIYETGEVSETDGERILSETVRPYTIEQNEPIKIDLDNCLCLPSGFSYKIQKVSAPGHGMIKKMSAHEYAYTPDPTPDAAKESGKIFVRISVKKDDGRFEVGDKILVMEFVQKQTKPHILVRSDYSYGESGGYSDAATAFEEGFKGFTAKTSADNAPNAGTALFSDGLKNTVSELTGKIFVQSTGKYRIALRGNGSSALFVSSDGKNYSLAAKGAGENFADCALFRDCDLTAGSWLYFKHILICSDGAFSVVGMGKFDGVKADVQDVKGAYRNNYVAESAHIFVGGHRYKNLKYSENFEKSFACGTLLSGNYAPREGYGIENLFDSDEKTYFSSAEDREISESNPFEITVDLGEEIFANNVTLNCISQRKYLPKAFKIEAGARLDDMRVIVDRGGVPIRDNGVFVNFNETKMRYYRLTVTQTYSKENGASGSFLELSSVTFGAAYSGFTRVSPDDGGIKYTGEWTAPQAMSSFGHIYCGGESSRADFTFYGSQFALYSVFGGEGVYEIYVDGSLAGEVNLGGAEGTKVAFLSEKLAEGRHEASVRGKSGSFNIDSFAVKYGSDPLSAVKIPELKPDEGSEAEEYRKPDDLKDENRKPYDGKGKSDGINGWQVGLCIIAGTFAVCAAAVATVYFLSKKKSEA